jgi:hypothetical protein
MALALHRLAARQVAGPGTGDQVDRWLEACGGAGHGASGSAAVVANPIVPLGGQAFGPSASYAVPMAAR